MVKTSTLSMLVACPFLALGVQGEGANVTCPEYRQFNPSRFEAEYVDDEGLSIQYMAPNGCECVEGMDDMHCKFCETDEGCQSENANQFCRRGVTVHANDTYKSFKCRLSPVLELLMPRGELSLHMDQINRSAHMVLYNWEMAEPINGGHAIECNFYGCDMIPGEQDVTCEESVCDCTDQCSDFSNNIVLYMSGHEAFFNVTGDGVGEHHVELHMEGAPFDIAAICTASACVEGLGLDLNKNMTSFDLQGVGNSTEVGK
ncbi:ABC-2 type transporter [Seminavis robusta]|uniref:ABC-2 type transporter n=1 Tax=Seminavis robusta TaxID=568900 RepID=A0A9N8HJ86_9STRA|nr:ABC-2 type transporter [Seminavis robusta]|eukprot:Sro539_g162840.1 ABC-2 type transporter (259) ;mRNA; r:34372-35275